MKGVYNTYWSTKAWNGSWVVGDEVEVRRCIKGVIEELYTESISPSVGLARARVRIHSFSNEWYAQNTLGPVEIGECVDVATHFLN